MFYKNIALSFSQSLNIALIGKFCCYFQRISQIKMGPLKYRYLSSPGHCSVHLTINADVNLFLNFEVQ